MQWIYGNKTCYTGRGDTNYRRVYSILCWCVAIVKPQIVQ